VDLPPADPPTPAARLWAGLDKSWQEAFRQAWEALQSGNIAVGACASTPDGEIVRSARKPTRIGPRRDELGTFATLMSRFGPALTPRFEKALRTLGEGPMVDLVHELEDGVAAERLAAMEVNEALGYLWPRLQELTEVIGP
jgi:hypothetical protein